MNLVEEAPRVSAGSADIAPAAEAARADAAIPAEEATAESASKHHHESDIVVVEPAAAELATREQKEQKVQRDRRDEGVHDDDDDRCETREWLDLAKNEKRGSFLGRRRSSLHNTTVEALRSRGSGPAFEGYAAVLPGAKKKSFAQLCYNCFLPERDFVSYGEAKRFVLVKSIFCFVYEDMTSPHPLYAIDLTRNMIPVYEDPASPSGTSTTVTPNEDNRSIDELETILLMNEKTKEVVFQFTFKKGKEEGREQQGESETTGESSSSRNDNHAGAGDSNNGEVERGGTPAQRFLVTVRNSIESGTQERHRESVKHLELVAKQLTMLESSVPV